MAYDEGLAHRVRETLGREAAGAAGARVEERRMFGGLSFLLNGHMCCGVLGDRLVLRLGDDAARDALARDHVAPMDFTGRPTRGMVYVATEGVADDEDLAGWIDRAVRFTTTLPPKPAR